MLNRCYKAEMAKLLKGKGIYIALVIMLVFVLFLGLFANLFNDVFGEGSGIEDNIMQILKNTPRDEYAATANKIEERLHLLEGEASTMWNRFVDEKGAMKTMISVLRYLDKHREVDIKDIVVPSSSMLSIGDNLYNFMLNAIKVVTEVAIFYAVIMMSGILASEYRDGTLRMQILRRNSRATILTSKWLAVFTVSGALFMVGVIASSVFAAFKFKLESKSMLSVIANSDVLIINEYVFMLIQILFALLAIFAMIQFSVFMCSISRFNRAGSMAIPIIVILIGNVTAYLLQVIYLGVLDFANNINLIEFLIPSGMDLPYTSLYTALPILLTYVAIFMTTSYIKFKKMEL